MFRDQWIIHKHPKIAILFAPTYFDCKPDNTLLMLASVRTSVSQMTLVGGLFW